MFGDALSMVCVRGIRAQEDSGSLKSVSARAVAEVDVDALGVDRH
jgi:hypothetical protein